MNQKHLRGALNLPLKETFAGTVIVEASFDTADLVRRLESVLSSPDAERHEVVVVCLDSDRGVIEATLSSQFRPLPVISLAPEDADALTNQVLHQVRTDRVRFLPVGASFSEPRWNDMPDGGDFLMVWAPETTLPKHGMRPQSAHVTGWLASTGFLRKLSGLGSPADWKLLRLAIAARQAGQTVRWLSAPATASRIGATPASGIRCLLNRNSSVLALVPHYRCEEWLADYLESLVTQTRAPEAIVVMDDSSENPPVEIVRRFPQVTLLAAAENVGPYRLIQEVINHTDYDAYLFQDADDWSTEDRLETLLAEAERTSAELVGSLELRILCAEAEVLPVCYPIDVNAALAEQPTDYPLLIVTTVVSRDLVQRLGGFATGLRFSGDIEFLRRAAHVARIVNVPRYCYVRRKRAGSLTTAPDTGMRSPERIKLRHILNERAIKNGAAVAKGEAPLLEPYAVAGPIQLTHVLGPKLKPTAKIE